MLALAYKRCNLHLGIFGKSYAKITKWRSRPNAIGCSNNLAWRTKPTPRPLVSAGGLSLWRLGLQGKWSRLSASNSFWAFHAFTFLASQGPQWHGLTLGKSHGNKERALVTTPLSSRMVLSIDARSCSLSGESSQSLSSDMSSEPTLRPTS